MSTNINTDQDGPADFFDSRYPDKKEHDAIDHPTNSADNNFEPYSTDPALKLNEFVYTFNRTYEGPENSDPETDKANKVEESIAEGESVHTASLTEHVGHPIPDLGDIHKQGATIADIDENRVINNMDSVFSESTATKRFCMRQFSAINAFESGLRNLHHRDVFGLQSSILFFSMFILGLLVCTICSAQLYKQKTYTLRLNALGELDITSEYQSLRQFMDKSNSVESEFKWPPSVSHGFYGLCYFLLAAFTLSAPFRVLASYKTWVLQHYKLATDEDEDEDEARQRGYVSKVMTFIHKFGVGGPYFLYEVFIKEACEFFMMLICFLEQCGVRVFSLSHNPVVTSSPMQMIAFACVISINLSVTILLGFFTPRKPRRLTAEHLVPSLTGPQPNI
ncbi:hypothetical protein CYMTET_13608 [Cymbomonas tetramitiformis]|uniref:Uncharacterized protein n=1 Tax=Cymbomonas tetramitiformis TaxID=36881 RepID=A0AAE0GI71_9CHLO|nr:hypothetical protein CYMTET_13608 [Cymbomonas tetramitiformis]